MTTQEPDSSQTQPGFKYDSPEVAYRAARRRILNNALRRQQISLDLSGFGLTELPPEIGRLQSLQRLVLSDNQLTGLPPEIGDLSNLLELHVQTNKLVSLPSSLGRLITLRSLTLDENKLRELPTSIGNLANLQHLSAIDNNLKSLPREIGQLAAVIDLYLTGNELQAIPPTFVQLISLENLSLDDNQLKDFPVELLQLTNLETLDLDNNELRYLPPELDRLKKLMYLYLTGNHFTEFPHALTQLSNLRTLMISHNQLAAIPADISNLQKLDIFYCTDNLITEVPREIANLNALQRLDLRRNRLRQLPNELGYLVSLVPTDIHSFPGLLIEGNPLIDPYPTLIKAGQPNATKNVLAWLRGELDLTDLQSDDQEPSTPEAVSPPEPKEEAGPTFRLADGQIDLVTGPETSSNFDREVQETLHARIQRQVKGLFDATTKVGNQHPQLLAVVDEYARLTLQPTSDLDVVNLWAAGNALMAQANAFQHQDPSRTFSEPLEPAHLGLLTEVAALHGGFILGFPRAATLALRADQSRIGPELVRSIAPPTSNVLSALSRQRRLLSDRARRLTEALDSALLTGSWDAARVGYTSYATVRNALVTIGRICLWINDKGGSLVGSVVVASAIGAANLPPDTLQLLMLFLKANSADILSFAAPFPELRTYLAWIIDYFDDLELKKKR